MELFIPFVLAEAAKGLREKVVASLRGQEIKQQRLCATQSSSQPQCRLSLRLSALLQTIKRQPTKTNQKPKQKRRRLSSLRVALDFMGTSNTCIGG
jgi:hypothetical protein